MVTAVSGPVGRAFIADGSCPRIGAFIAVVSDPVIRADITLFTNPRVGALIAPSTRKVGETDEAVWQGHVGIGTLVAICAGIMSRTNITLVALPLVGARVAPLSRPIVWALVALLTFPRKYTFGAVLPRLPIAWTIGAVLACPGIRTNITIVTRKVWESTLAAFRPIKDGFTGQTRGQSHARIAALVAR